MVFGRRKGMIYEKKREAKRKHFEVIGKTSEREIRIKINEDNHNRKVNATSRRQRRKGEIYSLTIGKGFRMIMLA